MPYTPPSQRSPASSKSNSPILSRNHSYSEAGGLSSPNSAAHRPVLPHSSTSYLSKHRRTPSISNSPVQERSEPNGQVTSANGSPHHQTTPSKLLIPVGGQSTPPDSTPNSDDEDRGRSQGKLAELQQALQKIEVKRGHSPERHSDGTASAPPEDATAVKPLRPALTPEARKISHSRSSSEIALSKHVKSLDVSPLQTSDSSEEDEDLLAMKPNLVRKKSGELVKPALRPHGRRRPSSMPGTPSFSKAVHFNDDIEQVRHFLQVDRPIAVSAGSSPVETYDSEHEYPFGYDDGYNSGSRRVDWEIRLANFPRETLERKSQPVRVEKISLSPDQKSLVGSVAVANIAFQKLVVARFTLDYWKTTSEIVAEYNDDVRRKQANDGYDRFTFTIKLADQAHLETKTLLICVRYNVNGQDFWDNNNSMNYQVDFTKKASPKHSRGGRHGRTGSLGSIPRSRHSPPAGRPQTSPASFDDEFNNNFDSSRYQFGGRDSSFGETPNPTIRLKNKSKQRGNVFPDQPNRNPSSSSQGFSTRYDFGASLSAALNTAQTAMGNRSGIKRMNKPKADYFTLQGEAPSVPKLDAPRPDVLSSEKPDLKSAEYNELIQKYCFFGSGRGSPQASSPKPTATTDGTREIDSDGSAVSPMDSGSVSPSPPKEGPSAIDGADDYRTQSRNPSPFVSRSTSPGPVTGSDFGDRTTPPVSFGYPFNNMHGGIFPESNARKAILG